MSGAETDAAVKKMVNEFSEELGRAPASAASEATASEGGLTLFARVHAVYERSALGGRLTTRN